MRAFVTHATPTAARSTRRSTAVSSLRPDTREHDVRAAHGKQPERTEVVSDMPTTPPSPAGGIGRETADFGSRLVAVIIDWAVSLALFIPAYVLGLILIAISDVLAILYFIVAIPGIILVMGYIFMWGLGVTGQTPGKRMQGVAVLDSTTGQVLGGGRGVGRELIKGVTNWFCWIGSLWSLFDADDEALYDKVLTSNAYTAEKGGLMPIFPGGKPF